MLNQLIANSSLMAGGWIVVAIMSLSIVMWVLILDRYIFFWRTQKKLAETTLHYWRENRRNSNPLVNRRLRASLTDSFRAKLSTSIGTIHVITAILPLLGLLGTVTGMIKTFEVMTVFGSGNVRGMADGISEALITTMAGLLTALTGIYFASDLSERVERETEHLASRLITQRPTLPLRKEKENAL